MLQEHTLLPEHPSCPLVPSLLPLLLLFLQWLPPFPLSTPLPRNPLLNSILKMNSAIFNMVMLTSTLKNTKLEMLKVASEEVTHTLMPTALSKPLTTLLTIWDSVSKPPTCPLLPPPLRLSSQLLPSMSTLSPLPQFSKAKLPSMSTLSPLLPLTLVLLPNPSKTPLRSPKPRLPTSLSSLRLPPLNAEGGKFKYNTSI